MDKKLKRVITYRPNIEAPTQKEKVTVIPKTEHLVKEVSPAVPVSLDHISSELTRKTELVFKWISEHPEFKWSIMCKKIGLDKGNFQRKLKSKSPVLKLDQLAKIESFLEKYGYAK